MTRLNNWDELKKRVSWGSVFGGVVTVLAVSILLSVLGSSIGLFMFDPFADNPVSGIGTTVGIGTAVALIVSMIAGGFVAGKLAGVDGLIHGFLVWGTTLIRRFTYCWSCKVNYECIRSCIVGCRRGYFRNWLDCR